MNMHATALQLCDVIKCVDETEVIGCRPVNIDKNTDETTQYDDADVR